MKGERGERGFHFVAAREIAEGVDWGPGDEERGC